jgi:hypothetical protein
LLVDLTKAGTIACGGLGFFVAAGWHWRLVRQ